MNEAAIAAATVVPGLSLGAGGAALVGTRSRYAGILMILACIGLLASALARLAGTDQAGQLLLVASLMLPAAAAALAYPRLSFRHPIEFCAWVVVAAAGVAGTLFAFEPGTFGTLASVSAIAIVGHGWVVLEKGSGEDREAMLWLTFAALTIGALAALLVLQFQAAGAIAGAFLLAGVGPLMAAGVRRPGLADIRQLVVETVVVGVVALAYVATFVAFLALLDLSGSERPAPAALALLGFLLAGGVQPLRLVLRGLIDELLFGERPDPLRAAARVTHRVGDDPLLALRAIREALVLPYASISRQGVELASSGTRVTATRRFPLALGDDEMGEIVVGLRPGNAVLAKGDEQVLRIVAPLLAQTVRARVLADQLKQSRAAAITAIEEERRRLRRDLHDGLGPTFSGLAFTADAARNSIASDPEAADALLRRLRADAVAAVSEIRRLVYDMRPPALDELGLVPALGHAISSLATARGERMHVAIQADELPPLPAAIEVAVFRIAAEAVLNSARHSGGCRAWVHLTQRDRSIEVTVRDEGVAAGPWVPGVGLASMRERAAGCCDEQLFGGRSRLHARAGGRSRRVHRTHHGPRRVARASNPSASLSPGSPPGRRGSRGSSRAGASQPVRPSQKPPPVMPKW